MNVLDIQGMRQRVSNGYYRNNVQYPSKTDNMKDGFITDDERSVKWNREQVELAKQQYKDQQNKYKDEENRLHNLFTKDVIDYIVNFHNYKPDAARFIFEKAYEEGHSFGYSSVLDELEYILDIISGFLDYNK